MGAVLPMSVPVRERELPVNLEAHPLLVAHAAQRERLVEALTRVRSDLAATVLQRQETLIASVALPDGADTAEGNPALARLDVEIARLGEQETVLEAGIGQHDIDARRVRADARAEIGEIISAKATDIVSKMGASFDRLETMAAELERLRRFRIVPLPVDFDIFDPLRGYLNIWRRAVRKAGIPV